MNRGSCSGRIRLPLGHGSFNEAPIHESGKWSRNRSHGTKAVASMRPRFMNRGSAARAVGGVVEAAASMRPRFMNRGSAIEERLEGDRLSLQ